VPSLSGQPLNEPTRRRFCEWLWRRPQRWYLLGVPAGGLLAVVAGIAIAGGGYAALQYSSTETFCISCHEMSKAAAELSHRPHSSNALGIRARCADCHIPPRFLAGTLDHVTSGMRDSWEHLRSTIGTPTQYEAHRLEMAERVWGALRADDSAECRSCHTVAAMAAAGHPAQVAITPEVMHQSLPRSYTCIDCHQGIAHDLPAKQ
jgi:nitrate/TMAO reductase-like tetraheme cytochrome c subunit